MKKMNGDLMYKRIGEYANKCLAGSIVLDWKYKVTGEDKDVFLCGISKVVELTQTIMTNQGITFDMVSIIFVPYDGRKKVMLDRIMD